MAITPRKIQLFAKIEGDDPEADTICRLVSDTLEIGNFDNEPILCQLFVSSSAKLRGSTSNVGPQSSCSTNHQACQSSALQQQIAELSNKLDDLRKEIRQKNTPINIEGNTVWISGIDGMGNICTDDIRNTNRRIVKTEDYDVKFQTKKPIYSEPSNKELSRLSQVPCSEPSQPTIPHSTCSDKISVNKEILDQMAAEQTVPSGEKMTASRETLEKLRSLPSQRYAESDQTKRRDDKMMASRETLDKLRPSRSKHSCDRMSDQMSFASN